MRRWSMSILEEPLRTALAPVVMLLFLAVASPPAMAREPEATDVTESGLHTGFTQVRGGDKNAQLVAFGLWSTHTGFGYERPATIRVINSASFALGKNGIEGGFGNAVAGGVRAPFGRNHGLLLRGGFEGSIFGNQYLWNSLLELPQFHLGYQWLVPGSVADVAMKGGYVLLGRHNTGDGAVRDLGGAFEWGAIGNVHVGPVDLRSSYARIYARHGGSPVDLLEGAFCGNAQPIVLCTNFRYELGDVGMPDGSLRGATVSYVGMTLGFVAYEKKPKKAQ